MPAYLLGTDNGCTVAKAAVFRLDGTELAVASRKIETISPQPGYTEMDMDRSWQATVESIRAVLQQSAVDRRQIACVASTGHGNGLYLIDKQGRPAYHAIGSTDSRARKYVQQWQAAGVDKVVRPKTMQSLWPGQPNALLAWLREHEPGVLRRASWLLMCKDYIRFRLTGQVYAELTDMSGTSLMNVGTAQYDPEVLDAFGIAEFRGLLPPLVRSAELCGRVTAEAAAATGLAEGTPVAGGLFDVDACALSAGLVDEAQLCMVAGTWGCNQYVSSTPVVDEDVFMTSCYCVPGYYLMLEGSATSASNLEWFVTELFAAERQQAHQSGKSVYELCNELVAATPPGQAPVIFLPFLYGSNVHPSAKACFVGLTGWHGRGHLLRAIYEGVVFGHRHHVERLLKFRPVPERIRLSGGAARSEVWTQAFADCLQLPVEIPAGTELGALGAAICGAVAAGCYDSFPAAVGNMVRICRTQLPDPAKRTLYDAKYDGYQRVIAALSPVWDLLAS